MELPLGVDPGGAAALRAAERLGPPPAP